MIIIITQGIDIEDVFVKSLKSYFVNVRFAELYPVMSQIHIGLEHPFAALLDQNNHRDMHMLFPSITVVSSSDEKVPQLAELQAFEPCEIVKGDLADIGSGKYQVAPGALEWMNSYFKTNEKLYGVSGTSHRRDHISFEVWSENIQMKNEIYSLLELFLAGPLRIEMEMTSNLHLFDDTIHGQRSGNYNLDFGQTLYGGQIGFDADYIVQQTVLDSEIIELNKTVWAEVLHG
jgi:hypothetical protein